MICAANEKLTQLIVSQYNKFNVIYNLKLK